MWNEFSFSRNYKWLSTLSNIVEKYNNKKHGTIGVKPVGVAEKIIKFYSFFS